MTIGSRSVRRHTTWTSGSARMVVARALGLTRTQTGLVLVGFVVLVAVAGPHFAPHSATDPVGAPFAASGPGKLFGADILGRDVLSRFLHGGQGLLAVSLLATVLGVGVGTVVGITAAYRRGLIDDALMRCSDIILVFPQIVLILILAAVSGLHAWLLVVAVAVGHAPQTARVIRGVALTVIDQDFVQYGVAVGLPSWRLLIFDVLPNVLSTLMVEFGIRMTYSIAAIAGASFLGFGLPPPASNWGLMISENQAGIATAPWGVALPIIALAVLTVGTNLIADGIAQAAAGIGE